MYKRQEVASFAKKSGAVDEIVTDLEKAVTKADLLYLCMRPEEILDFLKRYGAKAKAGAIITDIGGVKQDIMEEANRLPKKVAFIGGHPMTGKERGGFAHADAEIFKGANYILIPRKGTPQSAIAKIERFIHHLGCKNIIYSTVEIHDAQIAYTSQLMHVLAAAVAESDLYLASKGYDGNSFRGTTRVARLDAQMWADLFLRNREPLNRSIRELAKHLTEYSQLLDAGNREALEKRLAQVTMKKIQWDNKEIGGK